MSQPPGSGPYPPQGPAPQQPPYGGQPPYGSQPPYGQPQQSPHGQQPPKSPYGPPQQPGYGQQQSYRAPGQAGPSPYGQGAPGWTSPGGVPPQLPKKKSRAGLVVGVVAIVLVLIVAGGVALLLNQAKNAVVTAASNVTKLPSMTTSTAATQDTTPTTTAAKTTAAGGTDVSCSGSTIDSAAYSAKLPSGWKCSSQSGGLTISDQKYDTMLVVQLDQTTDAAQVCSSLANTGTMTALPDTQWGGQTAKTAEVDSSGTKVHVRCVGVNDSVFYLMAVPITGTYDEVVAGVNALTSGWTWK